MAFDLIVIDLDNTLYAADNGVFARMDERMTAFVLRELGVDREKANELRLAYWKQYGTTLHGLILHHDVEPEGFLHEVHDIDVQGMLQPDTEVDAALAGLPGRKVIHTNGTREHAGRVLQALGIEHHFSAIYDIRFNAYKPKPCSTTLGFLLDAEGIDPGRTLVIDDMEDNLAAAREIGAKTALVSADPPREAWDYYAATFPEVCRRIREAKVQSKPSP